MKKIIFLFAFIFLLFATGCKQDPEVEVNPDIAVVNSISEWVLTQIPESTMEDIILPTAHPTLGGTIEWTSYDEDIIDNTGKVVSTTLPKDATLEFKVTYQTYSKFDFAFVKVSGIELSAVAHAFTNQFSAIITRDYEVKTEFSNGYTVTWTSSNTSVFSNEGIFTRPDNDTMITIDFTVSIWDYSEQFSFEIAVQGQLLSTKIAEVRSWVIDNYLPERLVSTEITLPTEYEKYDANIEWESSNYNVIDNEGHITRYGFDRYITLTAKVYLGEQYTETDFSLVVAKKTLSTPAEKMESFLSAIGVAELAKVSFAYYSNISQSYNILPLFGAFDTPIVQQIAPLRTEANPTARPGTKLYSVEFITIHDTAGESAGANAKAHANLVSSGYSASWHYAVDQDGAYQSIPLDEVAWHAGDGSLAFHLTDTGVKATVKYPVMTITSDGYFAFNGEKSTVRAPKVSTTLYATTSQLTPSGIYNEIGLNGNYYINTNYFNDDYGRVSNGGGNRNSIGFETCVNTGSDYHRTFYHAANITSDLLIANNLSVDRVLQHNNFSGKDCPLSIRRTGYWNNFLDLVSLLKYGKENFSGYTFNWSSASIELATNGLIAKNATQGTNLSYSVTVANNTNPLETYSRAYNTLLK